MNTEWINVIPLTEELISNSNIYYYCGICRKTTPKVCIDYNANNIFYVSQEIKDIEIREYLNIDHKTYNAVRDIQQEVRFFEGFVVLLPFEVWDAVFTAIKSKTTRERKTLARLYLYLYYYAMRNLGSYSHSRQQMINELKMSKNNISNGTDYLEKCGFIRKGDYSVLDANRKARTYFIPETYWTDRCRFEMSQKLNGMK